MERRTLLKSLAALPMVKIFLGEDKVPVRATKLEPGNYLLIYDPREVSRTAMEHLGVYLDRMGVKCLVVSTYDEEALKLYRFE